jgi:phage antirepressor YoqD-like protein
MKAYTFYQVARIINMGIGRNTIFGILEERNIINERHIPKQEYIDAGFFKYIHKEKMTSKGKIYFTVLYATDAGIQWLVPILKDRKIA